MRIDIIPKSILMGGGTHGIKAQDVLESWGLDFSCQDPVKLNDLMQYVYLPDGWKKGPLRLAVDTSYVKGSLSPAKDLLDDSGRVRATIHFSNPDSVFAPDAFVMVKDPTQFD